MSSCISPNTPGSLKEPKTTPEKTQAGSDGHGVSEMLDQSPEASEQNQNGKLIKKKEELRLRIEELQDQIVKVQAELEEVNGKLGDIDASARVRRHIKLLHQYNEIKDIGMGLFGVIAEQRGVRVKDVFEEFGMGEND